MAGHQQRYLETRHMTVKLNPSKARPIEMSSGEEFVPDRVWPERLAKSALIALAILGVLMIVGMAVCTGMTLHQWLHGDGAGHP
jgi:hypothetical protein